MKSTDTLCLTFRLKKSFNTADTKNRKLTTSTTKSKPERSWKDFTAWSSTNEFPTHGRSQENVKSAKSMMQSKGFDPACSKRNLASLDPEAAYAVPMMKKIPPVTRLWWCQPTFATKSTAEHSANAKSPIAMWITEKLATTFFVSALCAIANVAASIPRIPRPSAASTRQICETRNETMAMVANFIEKTASAKLPAQFASTCASGSQTEKGNAGILIITTVQRIENTILEAVPATNEKLRTAITKPAARNPRPNIANSAWMRRNPLPSIDRHDAVVTTEISKTKNHTANVDPLPSRKTKSPTFTKRIAG